MPVDASVVPSLAACEYKSGVKPIWCPGCGHFAVLAALAKTLAHLGIPKHRIALISGIGCASRLPAYLDVYGFHGVHGRALAVASGLKAARPDLTVLAAGGDGDGFSIGTNHFLHACRRNMDMTYLLMDNQVYGMTKGQASPTTNPDWFGGGLTPAGTGVRALRPAEIALAAGATFIARGFSGDPGGLTRLFAQAIEHRGFAFVQVLSPCRTFRPEQQDWKRHVREIDPDTAGDPAKAAAAIRQDDGMTLGVLHREQQPVFAPPVASAPGDPADIEQTLLL